MNHKLDTVSMVEDNPISHELSGSTPDADNSSQTGGLLIECLTLDLSGRNILADISISLPASGITCLIGSSGAGKSSLLRCINRLHDGWMGHISLASESVRTADAHALRRQIGLIGQKPAVFPCSIEQNVTFGLPRTLRKTIDIDAIHTALEQAALWPEVESRLDEPASHLSLGQQQRLCLARALVLSPAMLLLDEPTSALDPRSRDMIEHAMHKLAADIPLLWVTHDLEQAKRIADQIVFLCDGRLIEQASADVFFSQPKCIESREFLRWSVCDC